MDAKEIKDLLRYVRNAGFQEFELRMQDFRLRVVKDLPAVVAAPANVMAAVPAPVTAVPAQSAASASEMETKAAAAAQSDLLEQASPMVGTFYRSPSPDADPFVKVGDVISVGQVLCIIEAMKLMNEIESEVAGEIVEILPENSQPVEYGEPIFRVRPHKTS